ncbi:MAG: 3-isopropylmalate dehydratase small subunit [Acidobacteriaceae bacterium]
MKPFRTLTSKVAPLDRVNVDTDQIIPKQFLKRIERTGYGEFLFFDWRRGADGAPNPEFALNRPQYQGAEILVAGRNFGCGSSREHAAWALSDFGFRCVIAPSFADIFFSNAAKNGILLVTLPDEKVALLLERAKVQSYQLHVSLESQTVKDDLGFEEPFTIDAFRRSCLLEGLDDIGLAMRHTAALDAYEQTHDAAFWSAPRQPQGVSA